MPIDINFGDMAKLLNGWGRSAFSTGKIGPGSTSTVFQVKDEVYIANQFDNYFLQFITGELAFQYFKITSTGTNSLTATPDRGISPAEDDIFTVLGNPASGISVNVNNNQLPRDSTTSPLVAGDSFISNVFNIEQWGAITGTLFTDQDSQLLVEQSADNSNFDAEQEFQYVANDKLGFEVPVVAPYGRVTLNNNSGANQTVLRLYVFNRRLSGV